MNHMWKLKIYCKSDSHINGKAKSISTNVLLNAMTKENGQNRIARTCKKKKYKRIYKQYNSLKTTRVEIESI